MDKKCLECLINKPKKDSLISNYSLQILNFKTVIKNNDVIIADLENEGEKKDKEIHSLSLGLIRQKRLARIGILGGLAGGFIGGLLLSK